ncbi:hypothetical protein RHGRI_036513 [Rhododendron griersonianum]|uniref:RNase H type-1 domain-containing protein n=1 Tax=Rhododendron griersonianum TaxID=479676 RepID=A0AAV6HP20_9ERIC|nr:hypothetical protein RHGRI_036513 [Rhododendron griersonianum]
MHAYPQNFAFYNTIPSDSNFNHIVMAAQEWKMLVGKRTKNMAPFWFTTGGKPPEPNGFKLNTDGASRNNSSTQAAAGGLVRDHNGNWTTGFCKNIGARSYKSSRENLGVA